MRIVRRVNRFAYYSLSLSASPSSLYKYRTLTPVATGHEYPGIEPASTMAVSQSLVYFVALGNIFVTRGNVLLLLVQGASSLLK